MSPDGRPVACAQHTDSIIWLDNVTNRCIANGIVARDSICVRKVHISESWDVSNPVIKIKYDKQNRNFM